jgi:membrane fusion protein (multidrug efflux system)
MSETDAVHGLSPPQTPADAAGGRPPGGGRRRRLMVLALVVACAAAGGGYYWWTGRGYESTDDAFVDGDTVQLSSQVDGRVTAVHFADNQVVAQGDLLVEIDPRDFQARVAAAQAALDAATAQETSARADLALTKITSQAVLDEAQSGLEAARARLEQLRAEATAAAAEAARADADVPRYRALSAKNQISRQALDRAVAEAHAAAAQADAARRAVRAAEAQVDQATARLQDARAAPQKVAVKEAEVALRAAAVEQARAALEQARLDLAHTRIEAPASGRMTKKAVRPGAYVEAGEALAALVYGQPWITANFKETQLTHMHPGQPVRIRVDAYPDTLFRGHVDSIQAGTGARFSLLPPENATGNFVKVVQRVPVKIVFDDPLEPAHFLALGMSAVPTVDVHGAAERSAAARAGTRLAGNTPARTPVRSDP